MTITISCAATTWEQAALHWCVTSLPVVLSKIVGISLVACMPGVVDLLTVSCVFMS